MVAAGKGRRSGLGINKVFFRFGSKLLIEQTLENICGCPEIRAVVVVLNQADLRRHASGLRKKFVKIRDIVTGGKERRDSVMNGLRSAEKFSPRGKVLIHDAARPFVNRRIVRDCLRKVGKGRGAVPGLAVTDTLKRVKNGLVQRTIDRAGLVEVQTPQAFILKDIMAAFRRYGDKPATDDCQVFESWGGKIAVIEGSVLNFKVTYPGDFELYKALVRYLWDK